VRNRRGHPDRVPMPAILDDDRGARNRRDPRRGARAPARSPAGARVIGTAGTTGLGARRVRSKALAGASAVVPCSLIARRAHAGKRTGRVAALAACFLLAVFFAGYPDRNRSAATAVTNRVTAQAQPSRPIETIQVGQRVLTSANQTDPDRVLPTSVRTDTWRRLRMQAENRWADGTVDVIQVETLQPPGWVEANAAQTGSSAPLPLDLAEMGLPAGIVARVVANEPCPKLAAGPGRVVLTTVSHLNSDIWELQFSDERGRVQTVCPTGLHKFYSGTRKQWVSARDLKQGEKLVGILGPVLVRRVAVVPAVRRVYNVNVEGEHTYRVSALGVLVHNNGCVGSAPSAPVGRLGQPLGNVAGNAPTTINGVPYSGHAVDMMQARGIPPSVVKNTITNGIPSPGNKLGTTAYQDPTNGIKVVTNTDTGKVITVMPVTP
jgi:hypothetical protein